MTGSDALSAIAGIQQSLTAVRSGGAATTSPATSGTPAASSADVFAALLAKLTGSAAASPAQDAFGQQLVDDARGFIGTPYVLGGSSTSGIDCSGLVKTVLAKYGVDAAHDSSVQATMGTEVSSLAEARPGDLIVFNDGHHIGIYAGDNKVIHAPSPGKKVVEQELWTDQPYAIRRIDVAGTTAASSATPAVDLSSVLSGLSLLGTLANSLGASGGALGSASVTSTLSGAAGGLGGTPSFDASMLMSSYLSSVLGTSPDSSGVSSAGDLTSLTLQRMALLQKGSA